MSDISSILTSLEAQVSSTLGSSWSELDYIYDLEQNHFKNNDRKYGVGADAGASVSGTNKAVTVDFGFFVVLTRNFINRSSDENERTILSDIYDQFNELNKNIFQKKLNNANILLVQDLSFTAPEKIGEATLAVRVDFTIKYRNQTV